VSKPTDHVHRFDRSWSNISPGKQVERSLNCSRSSFSFLSEVLGPDASEESISLSGCVGRGLVKETVLIKTKSSHSRVEVECTPYAVRKYIAGSRRPELSGTAHGPRTTLPVFNPPQTFCHSHEKSIIPDQQNGRRRHHRHQGLRLRSTSELYQQSAWGAFCRSISNHRRSGHSRPSDWLCGLQKLHTC
jgi:hypothetical protein